MSRAFWSVTGSVLFAGSIATGGYQVASLLGHDEYSEDVTYSAAGVSTIDIVNEAGSVTVIGTDAATQSGTIHLTAHVSSGVRETENRHEIAGDTLVVRSSCPNFGSQWCEASYILEVPHDMAVSVHNDDESIRVSDISGAVELNGDNGSIRATRLSGDVHISTDNGTISADEMSSTAATFDSDNGDVRATFSVVPRSIRATSDNGDVTIEVPPGDATYRVETSTDNGSTHVDVLQDPASERLITVETDNGDLRVRYAG